MVQIGISRNPEIIFEIMYVVLKYLEDTAVTLKRCIRVCFASLLLR